MNQSTLEVIVSALALCAGAVFGGSAYRDPQGRFTVPVPAGWTQTAGEGFLKLDRGQASAIVLRAGESGSPQAAVEGVLQQIAAQWRSFQRQESTQLRFGGQPGFSAGGFGVNAAGAQAFAIVYAAASHGEVYAMVIAAPTSDIQSINPDLQTIVEGFALDSGSPAVVQPQAANTASTRRVRFNGRALTPEQLARLENLERQYRARVPDGEYWYDNRSGAAGNWGGPGIALLGPGLELGGPMPANASGGGSGRFTGTFINGREIHPLDVAFLRSISPNGQVLPGRFWVNSNGDFGFEGGPLIYNLYLLARDKQASQSALHRNANGGSASNAMDGISVGPGYFLDRGAGSSASKF